MDAERSGDGITKELCKKTFCGDGCSKELRNRRIRKEQDRSITKEIGSGERVIKKTTGEVNEVRAMPGWERVRVQIDSSAVDTVGPKEFARALVAKQTEMST